MILFLLACIAGDKDDTADTSEALIPMSCEPVEGMCGTVAGKVYFGGCEDAFWIPDQQEACNGPYCVPAGYGVADLVTDTAERVDPWIECGAGFNVVHGVLCTACD